MAIGLLPRLSQLTPHGVREWADQFSSRLEFLFQSPRQIGILEAAQFISLVATPGYVTIPTPTGDIVFQWGSGTIDPVPVAPVSPTITPAVATLAIGGGRPTVLSATAVTIAPGAGALAATGLAPVVSTTFVPPSGATSVTFPLTFPTGAFVAFAIGAGGNAFPYSVANLSTTGFTAVATTGGSTDNFYWLAVGH